MGEKPVLYDYFDRSASQLLAAYEKSKLQAASANLGDNRELFCSEFLGKTLPPQLRIGSGEVWDSEGTKTGQLDLIVFREGASRLTFGTNETYLAEGVFAVIEVKSNLTTTKLNEALDALGRVKALRVSPLSGLLESDAIKRPLRIVFAYEGATLETLASTIQSNNDTDIVDLVGVLSRGTLIPQGRLLEREDETTIPTMKSKASALGILYMYLVEYSAKFMARSVSIRDYYEPLNYW